MKLTAILTSLFLAVVALAQKPATDPGDPPNLKRYEGSIVFSEVTERFGKYDLLLSPWKLRPDAAQPEDNYEKKQPLEGSLRRLAYVVPDEQRTVLEVHRNYQADLTAAGWEILYAADQLHGNFGFRTRIREEIPQSQIFAYPDREETAYLAARRADADGDTYATVLVTRYSSGITGKYTDVKKGRVIVRVDVIKPQAMEQRMVFVDAAKMSAEITAQGRIALYGIQFDFNKADLKAESKPTLEEIAKVLQADAGLKLLVVGHTDNVGTLDFNRDLSARRAAAVVRELTTTHGIAAARLHAEGIAFLAPLASNAEEAGRAKNRRVELVRW